MKWKKGLSIFAGVSLCAVLLAGCGGTGQSQGGSDNKPKVIKFAGETTYPPFEYADGNTYKGFDVDLSNAIAKEMGAQAEYVSMGFDALIPALESGQIDAIASGMVITQERSQKINFTDPYYKVGLVMVVKQDNNTINSEADIAGKTVAAQIGTTGAFLAEKQPGTTVKQFDAIPSMLTDLENGNVQIVMLDEPVAKYYILQGGMKDLKIVPVHLQEHDIAIGVSKKNEQLLKDMNAALKKLKDNGEYAKLEKKWFGDIK